MRPKFPALLAAIAISCSASPPVRTTGPSSEPAGPADAGADAVVPALSSDAAAAATELDGGDDAGPAACPVDMKLVDGDYCTEVKHACLRKWHSKWTRKTVCTEFATPAECVGTREHKRYCIDTYEWPNLAGERPEVMNDFYQAQVKCAAAGKRMCTESEWTLACEGPEMKPFPYGYARDARKCNGDHMWDNPDLSKVERYDRDELARLWQGVRSGSQPSCVSDYGVADMPGNVDEVSFNEERTPVSRDNYDNAITGGNWYLGVRNQCRPKVYTHDDGWSYYFLGFRCCAEADGKPSDPRAPRQIRRRWDFGRVEAYAGFTVAQMREKLELRRKGRCTCSPQDKRCRIMCGDILGPSAVDADPNRTLPVPVSD